MDRIRSFVLLMTIAIIASACAAATPSVMPAVSSPTPVSSEAAPSTAPTPSPAATTAVTPAASPTPFPAGEAWIAYEGQISDAAGIRLVRPDGTGDHWAMWDVPRGPGDWQLHPDWSPDGSRIAFSVDSNADGTRDLWVAGPDGSDANRIVDCASPCQVADDPAWSPDGMSIVYKTWAAVDGLNPPVQLMLYDVASGLSRELAVTEGADYFFWPRWSPDGKHIVVELLRYADRKVETEITTGSTIAIVDVGRGSGSGRRLLNLPDWATHPDWSPKGDLIVFSTRPWTTLPDGPSNLYTIRPDGTGLTQITHFKAGETRATQPS